MNIIEYLKDPILVSEFQKYFGVRRLSDTVSKYDELHAEDRYEPAKQLEDQVANTLPQRSRSGINKNCSQLKIYATAETKIENGVQQYVVQSGDYTLDAFQTRHDWQSVLGNEGDGCLGNSFRRLRKRGGRSEMYSEHEIDMKEVRSTFRPTGDVTLEAKKMDKAEFPKNGIILRQNAVENMDFYNGTNDTVKNGDKDCGSGTEAEDALSSDCDSEGETREYEITNLFWYYLFCFGAALGDEIFYAAFFSLWFWNVDGAVGRRVIMLWSLVMYIGQALKDIICWPRPPSPPVVHLEKKWALEYGMPSTHAMIGVAVPFGIMVFTLNRYEYSFTLSLLMATVWCTIVCGSRVYLGMHSVLDVIGGLILVVILMFPLVPLVDRLDHFFLTHPYAPIISLTGTISMIVFYPVADRWTPARGDTTVVLGVLAGIQTGYWINFKFGIICGPPLPPPYAIIWPSYEMWGQVLLRSVIGLCTIVASRAVFKPASYATVCALLRLNSSDLKKERDDINNKQKIRVELSYKFLMYVALGLNSVCFSPVVFRVIGIERPTFHTEV